MMYKCPECGEIFEEPDYEEICLEEYNGVADLFPGGTRHYKTICRCPVCGESIDPEWDYYDEDEEEEYELVE